MSPKLPSIKPADVSGSGPGGKVQISDIQAKLGEIRGEVDEGTSKAKPYVLYAAVGGTVLVIVLAFVFGRKRGRRKTTWVEIRRQ